MGEVELDMQAIGKPTASYNGEAGGDRCYSVADLQSDMQPSSLYEASTACGLITGCARKCCECKCRSWSRLQWAEAIEGKVPLVKSLREYSLRKTLVWDILAGITVGIVHIPQGMGFALLAGLPPVYGLYTSIFPTLLYMFLTPSHVTSFGSQSLVCLMLGTVLQQMCFDKGLCSTADEDTPMPMGSPSNSTASPFTTAGLQILTTTTAADVSSPMEDAISYKVEVAVMLSFVVGFLPLLMWVFSLGKVCLLFSEVFLSACNAGAAFLIATSQLHLLLGLELPPTSQPFAMIKTWIELFANISETNLADMTVSFISIIVLFIVKIIVNQKCKARLKFPIPIDIIVVILSIAISYFANLHENCGLTVVGAIPQGIPTPVFPKVSHIRDSQGVVANAIPIALISFLSSVLMAKLFANKYNLQIDANQELLANSASNMFGSLFSCFPASTAPPRTMLFDSLQGKSQVAYLFSCSLLILVLYVLGPVFAYLPTAVLASIIVVALIPLFFFIGDVPHLYRSNKLDLLVWLSTFFSTILFGLLAGIIFGVLLSVAALTIHAMTRSTHKLVPVSGADQVHLPQSLINDVMVADSQENILTLRLYTSLSFINAESCVMKTMKQIAIFTQSRSVDRKPPSAETALTIEVKEVPDEPSKMAVIFDMSAVTYVDFTGVKVLKMMCGKLRGRGVEVVLVCNLDLVQRLEAAAALEVIGAEHIFFTLEHARQAAKRNLSSKKHVSKDQEALLN